MEFAAPVWDPYRVKDINKLEMVQRRAACFAKSDYRCITSGSLLIVDLGWRTLSQRRKDARLNLFGKAVCGKVAISVDKLKQPTKVTRSSDGATFTAITTRMDAFSFFPRTVREWIELTHTPFAVKVNSHTVLVN